MRAETERFQYERAQTLENARKMEEINEAASA